MVTINFAILLNSIREVKRKITLTHFWIFLVHKSSALGLKMQVPSFLKAYVKKILIVPMDSLKIALLIHDLLYFQQNKAPYYCTAKLHRGNFSITIIKFLNGMFSVTYTDLNVNLAGMLFWLA